MAVNVNKTSGGDGKFKLYVGIAALQVTTVNPSQAELQAMGYKAEKAPNYLDPTYGTKLVFFLEANKGEDKIRANHTIFLKPKKNENLFINKEGNFSKDRSKLTGTIRNPYQGETDLIQLIKDLAGTKKGEECYLETIDAIVNNLDTTEIKQILEACTKNRIKGYLTVRQGKYQSVYSKKFEREYSMDFSYMHKSIVDNQQYIKDDLGAFDFKMYKMTDFRLRPWEGAETVADIAGTANTTASQNGQAGTPPAEAATDDLPF